MNTTNNMAAATMSKKMYHRRWIMGRLKIALGETLRAGKPNRRTFLRSTVAAGLLAGAKTSRKLLAADQIRASVTAGEPIVTGQSVPELEGFDRLMSEFIVKEHVPGAALAITRGSRLVYARGFGWADREERKPVEPVSLFRLASVSKPFTSAAALCLVDERKLRLDDKIWRVLGLSEPTWKGARFDPRWKQITILELLQHRGGWDRDKSFDPILAIPDIVEKLRTPMPISPENIVQYMLGFPLDFAPGERYAYSNFGYILLGLAIARLSGVAYEAYVRRKVLAPLKITRMRLGKALLAERAADEVKYYDSHARTGPAIIGPHLGAKVPLPYGGENFDAFAAHGGWIASAPDLVRFAAAFDDPQHCPILTPESVRQTFARPPGLAGYDAAGKPRDVYYGCGWSVRIVGSDGKFNSWHAGMISGTSTLLVRRSDNLHWAALFNTESNRADKMPATLIDGPLHAVADKVARWPQGEVGA
jgi:N-acyl-D-amino-acid deacylase